MMQALRNIEEAKLKIPLTLGAIGIILCSSAWVAIEYHKARQLDHRVAHLEVWKTRVVEDGWIPPVLHIRLAAIEKSQQETVSELRALRDDLSRTVYRAGVSVPTTTVGRSYRTPESAANGDRQ